MAADVSVISVPLIQQSPSQRNDVFELFLQDVSGAYYAPYNVSHPVDDLGPQWAPRQTYAAANPPTLTPSTSDPPALVPVKPAPTNKFSPNFLSFPVGADLGSLSEPIPPTAYGIPPAKWPVPPAVSPVKP